MRSLWQQHAGPGVGRNPQRYFSPDLKNLAIQTAKNTLNPYSLSNLPNKIESSVLLGF